MAGYFSLGESKVRPGAYYNIQSRGEEAAYGAVDGVVAVLFQGKMGPLGKATIINAADGYEKVFGTAGTTSALREALYGGALKLIAVRIGTGGTAPGVSLTAATGTVRFAAKYPGAANFTVTIRNKLADSDRKECVVYLDSEEYLKVAFAAGGNEVAALVAAFAENDMFDVTANVTENVTASGVITNVSQSALTGGVDPTVTNASYTAALSEVEKYYFNTICIDTINADVETLVSAFLDRIRDAGQFGIAVFGANSADTLENRITAAAAFDKENVVYVVNPKAYAGSLELDGYQTAALIAGLIASTPSSDSVTHSIIERYTVLGERMTNSQMEDAELGGCLVLSTNANDQIWIDSAVNTLINLDADHDAGWKKIRRVKTRYELLYRANAQADALVGQVDNDVNGRATIIAKIQAICNAMQEEGKLTQATVEESEAYTADGDSCYFDIDVVDLDSAEHIYLMYHFQFSTVASSATE